MSEQTPAEYHIERFAQMAAALEGHVTRCAFSFPVRYGKVERNFAKFERERGFQIFEPSVKERQNLADGLADIAARHGIGLYTCCGDILINDRIRKAHCLDGEAISRIYYRGNWNGVTKPTRKECGCTESVDIGCYDTCPHGCIYCYANIHKEQAIKCHAEHDMESPFLGYSRVQGEEFAKEIKVKAQTNRKDPVQQELGL